MTSAPPRATRSTNIPDNKIVGMGWRWRRATVVPSSIGQPRLPFGCADTIKELCQDVWRLRPAHTCSPVCDTHQVCQRSAHGEVFLLASSSLSMRGAVFAVKSDVGAARLANRLTTLQSDANLGQKPAIIRIENIMPPELTTSREAEILEECQK